MQPNVFVGLAVVALSIAIGVFAHENGEPTCRHYIANTYLYLALAICLATFTVLQTKHRKLNSVTMGGLVIGLFALLFLFLGIARNSVVVSHALWVMLVVMFALLVSSMLNGRQTRSAIEAAFVCTLVFLVTSLIGFVFFDKLYKFSHQIGLSLLIALVSIVLYELFVTFVLRTYTTKMHRVVSTTLIFLFAIFLVHDTVQMQAHAKTCDIHKLNEYPNYPRESYNFFIDLANVFVRLLSVTR